MKAQAQETNMVNEVKTAEGVVEAGPDDPALLAATRREEAGRSASIRELAQRGELERALAAKLAEMPSLTPSQREQLRQAIMAEGIEISKATMVPGPVGDVSARQGGILPMGQGERKIEVTEAMFERAWTKVQDLGGFDEMTGDDLRQILRAALTPSA